MTDEHRGTHIYDKGRFELRETDEAIIDLKGDFPPIMIASNTVDDGSEPNCADKRSVLHLLNELSDNNPNEERHWYLKEMLDKCWKQYHEQKDENEELKYKINNLLYQIECVGKNNKSCNGCECFLEDIGYCWMWDMEVEADDVVVACDQRKVKNTNEMMSDD